uniref:MPN domain-containing protein n=1 Tax=Phaeomonas parva TaxID=124430 RepID=A0A6U4GIS3_9STRA
MAVFFGREASLEVKVHPLVPLSILDHYQRRESTQGRVIGTLLGKISDNCVEITNCYAVRHAEPEDFSKMALGRELNAQMCELTTRVAKREVIVGWYSTTIPGVNFPSNNVVVHAFYCEQADNPVILTVDTRLETDEIVVNAFTVAPIVLEGEGVGNILKEHTVITEMGPQERICVDKMITGGIVPSVRSNNALSPEMPVDGSLSRTEDVLEKLLGMLTAVSGYVDDVVAGRREPDNEVGALIAASMASVPRLRPELFQRSFADSVQDMLMVDFLASLTKTQLEIAERINASL